MRASPTYSQSALYREKLEYEFSVLARREALEASISSLQDYLNEELRLEMESEDVSVMSKGAVTTPTTVQTLTDILGEEETKISPSDPLVSDFTPVGLADIQDFLRRPVSIYSGALTLGSANQTVLNPWNLFFSAPTVRAKLRNFGFVRADLHLRIAVSGTPFHYGRVMVTYVPLTFSNDVYSAYTGAISGGTQTYSSMNPLFYNWMSQFTGTKIIDVKENKPVEMTLPFLAPAPMCRLYNASSTTALATSSNYNDINALGSLIFACLNPIASVSSSPSTPYIYIYGWLENVHLAVPTGSQTIITTEGGDERDVGPVEKVSSSLLSISRALEKVPVIKPWATASSVVLSSVNSIASYFGWSYPNRIEPATRMKPEPFQNGANCIGMDTGKRITIDPKQEVSVDPRFYGTDKDELSLAHICSIESFLNTVSWTVGTAPLSIIYAWAVTPRVGLPISNPYGGTHLNHQPTALAFAAAPFNFWNGTIKFTFQIVCSSFARGKFIIGYEPNIAQFSLVAANLNLNKQYYTVVDLQETDTVEMCVPWAFHLPFAQNVTSGGISGTMGSTISSPANYAEYANGFIFIAPLTELQNPDNSAVSINTFISGSEMNFAYPDYSRLYTANSVFGSFMFNDEKVHLEMETSDSNNRSDLHVNTVSCIPAIGTTLNLDKASNACFGEVIPSFRLLLKRFHMVGTVATSLTQALPGTTLATLPSYPTKSVPFGSTSLANGMTEQSLFDYLAYAYAGWRGGIRHRVHTYGMSSNDVNVQTRVCLTAPTNTAPTYSLSTQSTPFGANGLGTVVFALTTNAGIEFETPYYSSALFHASPTVNYQNGASSNTFYNGVCLRGVYVYTDLSTALSSNTLTLVHECATGEDFSFGRWLAAPPHSI